MTFLAPAYLVAAAGASVILVALHFLATKRPEASPLPTIRFVPEQRAVATVRHVRLSHLLLLLLRVAIVLAIGAALAGPLLQAARAPLVRVVVADLSRASASPAAARDSARAWLREGDALVLVDSTVRTIAEGGRDSLAAMVPGSAAASGPGALSASLVAALRQASVLRDRADSVELVLVSPFAASAVDAATMALRSRWPGRARLVRLVPASPATSGAQVEVAWAGAERPVRAIPRARMDTAGAVVAGQDIVVAPFQRRWEYPADSVRGARVTARWMDGAPAAIEWPLADGCGRSTVVPRDTVGDLVVRPEFARLTTALGAPCAAEAMSAGSLAPPQLAMLAGGPEAAAAGELSAREGRRSPLAPWLLALAALLAGAEWLVRRRGSAA